MIIETVTAVAVVETGREILEILHLLHVGHMTGKASYKKGDAFMQSLGEKYQKWRDQKCPDRQLTREASTLYDFDATGNDQEKVKDEAEKYLAKLKDSVKESKKAQKYFLRLNTTLIQLVSALKSNNNVQCEILLSELRTHLNSFKDKLEDFLDLIEPPPRGILYLADLLQKKDKEGVIERFNKDLKKITNYIELLDEKKQQIANRIKEGFEAIHTSLSSTSSSAAQPFEQSQQDIEEYIDFLKTEQANPLEANPNWFPLLTADEQIEAGQRIFLHAMDEPKNNEDEKLLIAQIFLRKPVPQQLMKQNDIDMQAHEMAGILLEWQIKKCGELTKFLKKLKQGKRLPNYDRDGLREWLETKKREQNPIALFKEILVLPCCLSECSPESAHDKLDKLLLDENPHELIQKHQDSHWGAIWEKNDSLIQLPPSFQTNILPRDRKEQDDQSEDSKVVSSVMQELATKLITDLERLKTALEKNIRPYSEEFGRALLEKTKASEVKKNDEHAVGVARIKDAARRTIIISSPRSSLYPYLYQANTINEEDKKRQVPTLDDLSQVIYIGLDPKGVCKWKASSTASSQTNQLAHYFYPDKENDSRKKAWLYAYIGCQLNIAPLLSHLFSNTDRPLPLTNTPEPDAAIKNGLSIQAILEDPNKMLSLTNSKALSGLTPKMVEKTQTVYQELQDYHVLALVRMNPEYSNKFSFMKQWEYLFKNFFKFSKKIGEERLMTVQIIIGGFSTALSAEHVQDIKNALETLKGDCEDRREKAKPNRSSLYTLINKLLNGPVKDITNQFNGYLEKTTADSEPTAQQTVAAAVDAVHEKIEEANKKTEEERKEKEKERKEKEAAQAREEAANKKTEEIRKEKENERKEKEAAQAREQETQAENERLKALLAALALQPTVAGSRGTLFHAPTTTSQESNTAAENASLPGYSYGS